MCIRDRFLSVYITVRGLVRWLYLLQLWGWRDNLFLYIIGSCTRHIKGVLLWFSFLMRLPISIWPCFDFWRFICTNICAGAGELLLLILGASYNFESHCTCYISYECPTCLQLERESGFTEKTAKTDEVATGFKVRRIFGDFNAVNHLIERYRNTRIVAFLVLIKGCVI